MKVSFHSSHGPCENLAAHRHRNAYAALVLEGGYEEWSIDGRYACTPGCLVVHPPWHAHANEFGRRGARVLNLPAPIIDSLFVVRVPDPDAIMKLAERCPERAGMAALEEADVHAPAAPANWLTRLVLLLARDNDADIATLSARCGVSPEHASRACKRWFGAGPAALRREGRLRVAMRLLREGTAPAEAASAAGFSDQAHLTRLLKRATGLTPARFRTS